MRQTWRRPGAFAGAGASAGGLSGAANAASSIRLLPSGALAEVIHGALGAGDVPGQAWLVLVAWAVATPVVAARLFRWE